VSGACQAGTDSCAPQLCDEIADECVGCFTDADCNDGLYCNGEETCVSGACQAGTDSCAPQLCDEKADECVDCLIDADCNDGVYCNGEESCVDKICEVGSDPCTDDGLFCNGMESCDEENDECLNSGNPCSSGETCDEEGDVCLPLPAPLSFELVPKSAIQSHLIPLPLFMFIVSDDDYTKFEDATTVGFSGEDIVNPPVTMVLSENPIFVFSLIKPAGLGSTKGSVEIEVSVSTTEGEGTETLSLIELPLILDGMREKQKGEAI